MNETSVSMKIAAAAQGAQIDFNEDWYDEESQQDQAISGFEIQHMPIGLGYEVSPA